MAINENQSVFEEVNPFPEKMSVSSAIDGGTDIDINVEDGDSILGELEEIALNDGFGGKSIPIDDEIASAGSSYKTINAGKSDGSNSFDVESLAREIDSLNAKTSSAPVIPDEENEFLAVLGDDDRKMIDEVTRKTDGIEIDMFEPVGNLEEGDDSAQLVVPENQSIGPVSLWKNDNDYYITDVEGFGPETPSSILDFLEWKKEHAEISSVPSEDNGKEDSSQLKVPLCNDDMIDNVLHEEHFTISDQDLHDSSIYEDLILSPDDLENSGDRFEESDEDEILSLPEDALIALSEEAEVSEDEPVTGNLSDEDSKDEPEEIPGDFVLTPVDLSEAEKIAREDILILNEDDLIEELESSDSGHRKPDETYGKRAPEIERKVQYVHPASSVMDNSHRESIETDIIAPESLVIEEDGAEIKKRYEQSALKEESEGLVDITESVVILDDEGDVDRLSMSIPEDKREDMKKLLGYLDGLFEKLPDEVVKNFANSEYFDLYVKIMNDLGDK